MTERVLTPPIDPITAPVRSNAVDIVKGLAILLVTYEHTGQGMSARGWWTGPSRDFSYHYVYSFHMPAFFFVAGLFVAGSIRRRGAKDFVLEKMKTLLYLYVGWAILLTAIEPLISRFKQSPAPVHWASFPISLIDGGAGWFFPVLFLCLLLALFTIKMPAWLRLVLAVIAAALMPVYGYEVFYKTVWHFSFLAGGMLVGRSIFKLSAVPRWTAALAAVVVFALQAGRRLSLRGTRRLRLFPGLAGRRPRVYRHGRALSYRQDDRKHAAGRRYGRGSAKRRSASFSWRSSRRVQRANSC